MEKQKISFNMEICQWLKQISFLSAMWLRKFMLSIATLATQLDMAQFYGTGAEALVTARGDGTAIALYPEAARYSLIADLPPLAPSPLYGREADAKTIAERAAS